MKTFTACEIVNEVTVSVSVAIPSGDDVCNPEALIYGFEGHELQGFCQCVASKLPDLLTQAVASVQESLIEVSRSRLFPQLPPDTK